MRAQARGGGGQAAPQDGASLGVKSPEGEPCLWIACRRCATGCVKALLEAGADATTPYKGESLLEMMRSEDRDCAAAKAVISLLEAHLAASHTVVGLPESAALPSLAIQRVASQSSVWE